MRGVTDRTLRYRSVHDLNQAIIRWSGELDPEIALIVGVPRSGLMAASLLALHLHTPVMDVDAFASGATPVNGLRLSESVPRGGKILIIDDTVNSGREMTRVRELLAQSDIPHELLIYGAVYASRAGAAHVDTYAERLPLPRAFEWNILHHKALLSRACMDIDGVLCPDPTPDENDDGRRYLRFLSKAPLSYRPTFKVSTLVTSRLEKYRPQTEEWLARHEIGYDSLRMLDLPTAAERRRLRAHATHKAAVYLESGNDLFIESSAVEGRKIYELTGNPVFVTDTREFFGAGADPDFREPRLRRLADAIRRQ
jgi:uncharacterized HAD superfamily protein/hypoxanthine phosphoribosyltransferase